MTPPAKVGLGAALLALAAGALTLQRVLDYGLSARDEPTALEAFLARRLRHLAVPRPLREAKNPAPLSPEVLAEARAHFADHCASCHGNDGKGRTPMGRSLYPKAPDMTRPETQSLSDGELFAIIENGVRLTGMPAWGTGTPAGAEQSWKLVHFIRHLSRITAEELAEMEHLNPKSRKEYEEEEETRRFLDGGEDAPAPAPPSEHRRH